VDLTDHCVSPLSTPGRNRSLSVAEFVRIQMVILAKNRNWHRLRELGRKRFGSGQTMATKSLAFRFPRMASTPFDVN